MHEPSSPGCQGRISCSSGTDHQRFGTDFLGGSPGVECNSTNPCLATSGSEVLTHGTVGAATQATMSKRKSAGALNSIIVGGVKQVKEISVVRWRTTPRGSGRNRGERVEATITSDYEMTLQLEILVVCMG